jgi:hypothetical protein
VSVLVWRPPLERKPTACARDQENQRHPPGKKERRDSREVRTQLGILDAEDDLIEHKDYMEEKDSQDCDDTQPVEIILANGSSAGMGLSGYNWSLHDALIS